ncbi:putative lipoprotein [hydrothermal vent metagenome]|uniref:Putative lipoprotein n=1 Tax=hydrothermal vent metagenome TaxID=652676 RepID=A0A1W1CX09_9ZZZZ
MAKRALFLLTLTLIFSSCSSTPTPKQKQTTYKLHKKNFVTTTLYKEYKKWAGVHYRYGGKNTNGIDCSALVQTIYKEAFNIHLPRTTKEQLKIGKRVTKSNLKEGDILFFKTSYHLLHSGIYLERGNFIHASSKYGVRLSNIHNPYWRAKYYTARRILY